MTSSSDRLRLRFDELDAASKSKTGVGLCSVANLKQLAYVVWMTYVVQTPLELLCELL
jgi:hypothetical protein